MTHSPSHIIDRAVFLIDREGGFVPFIRNAGLGGIALAVFTEIIDGIQGFGTVLVGIPKAFGMGFILLIELFFRGLGSVFGAGTEATVRSFADGTAALLGPFAQPFSVGVIMLSVAVFVWSVNRLEISPLSFIRSVRG